MGFAEVASLAERRGRAPRDVPPGAEREIDVSSAPRASVRAHVSVVVVSDDAVLRTGIAAQVCADDISVLAAVESPDACAGLAPDVVVVPHRLPGTSAIDVCERLHRPGGPALLVIGTAARALLLRRVVQAGAVGFVAAESPAGLLRDAVRSVACGNPYFDPAVGRLVVDLIARPGPDQRPYGLTRAQLDVVALLPKGLRNREIAAELGITENTVKTHLRHALRKLNVPNRAQAAALVKREGLA